jgi:hypothetical protein
MPIDALYYIQNQLMKPLVRIFKPVLGGEASEVIRTLFGRLKTFRALHRGIDHSRFSPELREALFGNSRLGKRVAAPVVGSSLTRYARAPPASQTQLNNFFTPRPL